MHNLFTRKRRHGGLELRARNITTRPQALYFSWGWLKAVRHFECSFRRGGDWHHGMFTLAIPWLFVIHLGVHTGSPLPATNQQYGLVVDGTCGVALWDHGEHLVWWDRFFKGAYEEAVTEIQRIKEPVRMELTLPSGPVTVTIASVVARCHIYYYHRWYLAPIARRIIYSVAVDARSLDMLAELGYFPAATYTYHDQSGMTVHTALNRTVAAIGTALSTPPSANR